MAITEKTEEVRVSMDHSNQVIFVEEAIIIERDGEEIIRQASRRPIEPGADVSNESAAVQALAALWTTGE
jgi:hypothetical protein